MRGTAAKTVKVSPPTHRHTRAWIERGFPLVAGIDEVGRGSWAGPVVAAAVILPPRVRLAGVTDSKLLSPGRRVDLAQLIRLRAVAIGLGWVSAGEIDDNGLTWAVRASGLRALYDLRHPYHAVLLDGNHNYLSELFRSEAIIKGDQLSYSIAAASIIAKVARDEYMDEQHELYPAYGFASNKGYGTAEHARALGQGICPLHRRLFKPVQLQLLKAQA